MAIRRKKRKKPTTKTRVSFRVPDTRLEQLSASAETKRISRNKLLELLIHDFVHQDQLPILPEKERPSFTIAGFILPTEDLRALQRRAKEMGISRNQAVDLIINDHLERIGKEAIDGDQPSLFD
ncbi:MAG: hypothetical protein ACOVN5_06975 [Aquidulcibacter sp.]